MGVNIVAAFWGLAEATLFFIVPDVWTSAAGLKDLRRGLFACLWALAGALLGGIVMYRWGAFDFGSAVAAVGRVPAVSDAMIGRVANELANDGLLAILLGPLSGTPYKVYAVQAEHAGTGLAAFLLISIPARLIRFILVTWVCHRIGRVVRPYTSDRTVLVLLLVGWAIFYIIYFSLMAS